MGRIGFVQIIFSYYFQERQLHAVMADLFFAGTDTTSSTISWAMLYLTKYRDIQKKLQAEITAVTNDARHVTLNDRSRYLQILKCKKHELYKFSC